MRGRPPHVVPKDADGVRGRLAHPVPTGADGVRGRPVDQLPTGAEGVRGHPLTKCLRVPMMCGAACAPVPGNCRWCAGQGLRTRVVLLCYPRGTAPLGRGGGPEEGEGLAAPASELAGAGAAFFWATAPSPEHRRRTLPAVGGGPGDWGRGLGCVGIPCDGCWSGGALSFAHNPLALEFQPPPKELKSFYGPATSSHWLV